MPEAMWPVPVLWTMCPLSLANWASSVSLKYTVAPGPAGPAGPAGPGGPTSGL